jgi:hypothetical protein
MARPVSSGDRGQGAVLMAGVPPAPSGAGFRIRKRDLDTFLSTDVASYV